MVPAILFFSIGVSVTRTAAAEVERVSAREARMATLITALEGRLAALEALRDPVLCDTTIPYLAEGAQFSYNGCNRNVKRNDTVSYETCQNGTLTVYNATRASASGLFDIKIAANVPTHDTWVRSACVFVCGCGLVGSCYPSHEYPLRMRAALCLHVHSR